MNNKKPKHDLPKIGGNIMEMGKFVYRMIVVLSDLYPKMDQKDQELVVYEYTDKAKALKMRETIMIEGITLFRKDAGIEIDMFYPARQIRKIIIRKEPQQTKVRESDVVH